jgi:uncharacterized protein (TIGR00255 family)
MNRMIKSMTGFGRGTAADATYEVTAEVRAVNHRYGEFTVRMPGMYRFCEEAIKNALKQFIARGKVDVNITVVSKSESEAAVSVNTALAKQYFKAFRELQGEFDLTGDISLRLLSMQPDVITAQGGQADEEAVAKVITDAARAAGQDITAMRLKEGEKLAADIESRLITIESLLKEVEERAPLLPGIYAEKLRTRIAELTDGAGNSEAIEERIVTETAFFADKASIAEETVRLASHIAQFRGYLKAEEPIGKKMDFLVQEMNRETNTIGSKANDLNITGAVLELKSEIEKIREQVQNIE